jgi:L,D-peptidoglycan transpeptidase YkuD (ErfK/YbiS/YcfS/YnhG family)
LAYWIERYGIREYVNWPKGSFGYSEARSMRKPENYYPFEKDKDSAFGAGDAVSQG